MKTRHLFFVFIVFALLISVTGCAGLLTRMASPTSQAVISGISSTNDLAAVALLKEAQAVNAALNPTPYEPLINAGLGGVAALLMAASGWYSRHKATAVNATTPSK